MGGGEGDWMSNVRFRCMMDYMSDPLAISFSHGLHVSNSFIGFSSPAPPYPTTRRAFDNEETSIPNVFVDLPRDQFVNQESSIAPNLYMEPRERK